MCFLLIYKLGSKWSLFQNNINYSSNVPGKRSKILEKSGKNQGISHGKKCRYPDFGAIIFFSMRAVLFVSSPG